MQIHEEQKIKNKLKEILNVKFLLGICESNHLNNNVKYGVIFNENRKGIIEKFKNLDINLEESNIVPVVEGNVILEDNIIHKENFSFISFSNIIKEVFKEATGKYEILYPVDIQSKLIKNNLIVLEEIKDVS